MTKQEEKRLIDIYGPNYEYLDIPVSWRNRDKAEDEALDYQSEQYEDERFAERAELDAIRESRN